MTVKKTLDMLDMVKKSKQMRVSMSFAKLVEDNRKNLVKQGLARKAASDRFITHQLSKKLRKKKFIEL